MPSVIDFETGSARFSVNVPLAGVPLRGVLSERLDGVPVFVDNDATCAALAEALDDDQEPVAQVLVMITVGTGRGRRRRARTAASSAARPAPRPSSAT